MLLSYSFTNFHSFAEKASVSLSLTQRETVNGWDRASSSGQRTTTALAVFGANGAGKTSLIKVPAFIAWFIQNSFSLPPDAQLPFMPHMAHQDEPTEFEIEADGEHGWRWKYVLRATPQRVLFEALYRRNVIPGDRYGYVFTREWKDGAYLVRQQGFGLAESEAAKVRPNVSLIAWGRQYGAELAVHVANFHAATNVNVLGRVLNTEAELFSAASYFSGDATIKDNMRALLKAWDLGLSDITLKNVEVPGADGSAATQRWYPMGIHQSDGTEFELPFVLESSGTQTAFILLWRLLPILATGGLAFIDELENDLHPYMIEPLLRLFHDKSTNPHGAQIVFTCQSPEILKTLLRAQVMFVEKADCLSTAYRGDTIAGLTGAHNLYAKYVIGALGAVPQL